MQEVERERRVRIGCANPHLGCNPDRFHDLLGRGALLRRLLRMTLDAIRTLGGMRDGDGDELLLASSQCTLGKHAAAEVPECLVLRRGQFAAILVDVARVLGIHLVCYA